MVKRYDVDGVRSPGGRFSHVGEIGPNARIFHLAGHTITAVFEPDAVSETGFISCFAEPQEAAKFLTYKRGR
jgi:hypothetical protein